MTPVVSLRQEESDGGLDSMGVGTAAVNILSGAVQVLDADKDAIQRFPY